MSDMLNHYLCGNHALKIFGTRRTLAKYIINHPDAYRLGTQGPDFFYYGALLAPFSGSLLSTIGSTLHKKEIKLFYEKAFNYALKSDAHEILLSYLAGFSCHHALDVKTHPYVFYFTENTEGTVITSDYYHKFFEVLLDVANYRYNENKNAASFNFKKIYTLKADTMLALSTFFPWILKEIYGIEITPRKIEMSIKNTLFMTKFFCDHKNRKKNVLRVFENLTNRPLVFTRALYPDETDLKTVLNLDHKPWKHPCTGEVFCNSYPELFGDAVGLTVRRLRLINRCIRQGSFEEKIIDEMYEDLSYDKALNWKDPRLMAYSRNIFVDNPQLLK